MKRFLFLLTSLFLTVVLAGCGASRNTLIGAGLGAATGAVLTNGSTMGTVGGAAVGGAIGSRSR